MQHMVDITRTQASTAAVTRFHVAYSDMATIGEHDLRAEVEHAGRRLAARPMWEEFWSGPETPEEQARTEVYWPLSPATES
jgi:hypothetical protein